jgi:hypothetical protein
MVRDSGMQINVMKIEELIRIMSSDPDCRLLPAKDLPPPPPNPRSFPNYLITFYRLCGGMVLFPARSFGFQIVPQEEMKPATPLLKGDFYLEHKEDFDSDISSGWYLIARGTNSMECVTIDLSESRRGYCYDSFWDVYATPDSKIVAKSFTELVERLYQAKGNAVYWADNSFDYGTAYGTIRA